MRNVLAIAFTALLFLVSKQGSAQTANTPTSFDKPVPVSAASQADTLNVIVNQPKRIADYYSVPVPVKNTNDTAAVLVNPARPVNREDDPR